MTLRKATFTITVATGGEMGSDDVLLPATVDTRHARLEAVTIDRAAGFASAPAFTIYELDEVETTDLADDSEELKLGAQLFHIGLIGESVAAVDGVECFYPRRNVVDQYGSAQGADAGDGRVLIKTHRARCFVERAVSGDVYDVTMYYETAGDYRF